MITKSQIDLINRVWMRSDNIAALMALDYATMNKGE